MTTSRCLLLIDLQNEFISPGGHFPIHENSRTCLTNIDAIARAVHHAGVTIFWIRSEYGTQSAGPAEEALISSDEPCPDPILYGTHTGRKKCCEKGTTGADYPEYISALISETSSPPSASVILTKHWFSAFRESTLLVDLRARGITELYVGGLLSNVCVLATVTEACSLGFNVTVLEDCLGWRKRESHQKALESMRTIGAQVTSSQTIRYLHKDVQTSTTYKHKIPTLYYVNGSIPSWRVLMALYEKGLKFDAKRLKVMSNPKETRLPAFFALNHRRKTPVFVDVLPSTFDGPDVETINVNESLAILYYIETYHNPDVPLLPPSTQRAAHALALSRIQETENLHIAYNSLEDVHFEAANSGVTLDDGEHARLVHNVQRELDYWEVYAGKTTFIAGDGFGFADCAFFPLLAYVVHRGFDWRRREPTCEVVSESICESERDNARGSQTREMNAWPSLKRYFEQVWDLGGENGSARRAQPDGWSRPGKANVWRGTKGNSK